MIPISPSSSCAVYLCGVVPPPATMVWPRDFLTRYGSVTFCFLMISFASMLSLFASCETRAILANHLYQSRGMVVKTGRSAWAVISH